MHLSAEERAQRARYNEAYLQGELAAVRAVNRHVCGCDYGATSWTTRREADRIAAALGLGPGTRLLDLGSGAGWPGVYFAREFGCEAVMVDLPEAGLRIAGERAASDGVAARCRVAMADAAALPFGDGEFALIHHADLLCCLVRKKEVLAECRRVAGPGARMIFTVISVAPGLRPGDRARAAASGPEFVETETGYRDLLAAAGWRIGAVHDLTADFIAATRRSLEAHERRREALSELLGEAEMARRDGASRARIAALSARHLRREMFVVGAA
ncbi:MAG: class I SAM-dependent methyltransferase [Paracoccaceae bacterium]